MTISLFIFLTSEHPCHFCKSSNICYISLLLHSPVSYAYLLVEIHRIIILVYPWILIISIGDGLGVSHSLRLKNIEFDINHSLFPE